MSFASLGLSDALVRAVTEHGYTQPTPIQQQAIPAVLAGGDLLAGAQTGTGKTAGLRAADAAAARPAHPASAQPLRSGRKPIRALILTPTRELAAQVEESVRVYGKYSKLASMVVFGGVGIGAQTAKLRRGVDILVATPGRLLDHHGQGNVDFSKVEILVLDEADRMLDMGFIRDIRRILSLLPRKRQNLLFSATFSDEIKDLADTLLDDPALIEVARRNSTVEIITQTVHPVDRNRKRELLSHLIKTQNWYQVLVFTRTKHGANKLAEQLNDDGITALAIHGNKSQGARTRALAEFKDASLQVLVATDIAARGIDIDQLPHVVNYDLPNVPHDYVHRIGRTGRAGATGRGHLARLRRRARVPARHREADQAHAAAHRDRRLRARSGARAEPILQRQGRGQSRGQPGGQSAPAEAWTGALATAWQARRKAASGTSRSHGRGRGPPRRVRKGSVTEAAVRMRSPTRVKGALAQPRPGCGPSRRDHRRRPAPRRSRAVIHRFGGRGRLAGSSEPRP
jgi:ATP-dependent RNA helicase RhlE